MKSMTRYTAAVVLIAGSFLGSSFAGDPLPSTVEGLSIDNAHELTVGQGRVIRGAQPKAKVSELKALGITDVIILKNQTGTEVDTEIESLKKLGYKLATEVSPTAKTKRIHWAGYELLWKDIMIPGNPAQSKKNAVKACKQVIGALNLLQTVGADPKRAAFFHCTVGQDRTGVVAGLYRVAESGWTESQAYQNEMCAHGFAEGYVGKPEEVSAKIRTHLLPVFKMALSAVNYAKSKGIPVEPKHCLGSTIDGFDSEQYPYCAVNAN